MRTCRTYLGFRGFATVLRGCDAHPAGFIRPDPPWPGAPWHRCATVGGPSIVVGNGPRFGCRISERGCSPPERRSPGPPQTLGRFAPSASSLLAPDSEKLLGGDVGSVDAGCSVDAWLIGQLDRRCGGPTIRERRHALEATGPETLKDASSPISGPGLAPRWNLRDTHHLRPLRAYL